MDYEKVDGSTLKVTKTVEAKEESNEYDYDFLKQQELDILKQRNDFCEARDVELAEVRVLIAEANKLEITSKVEVSLAEEEAKEITLTKWAKKSMQR